MPMRRGPCVFVTLNIKHRDVVHINRGICLSCLNEVTIKDSATSTCQAVLFEFGVRNRQYRCDVPSIGLSNKRLAYKESGLLGS
jgi:hypothetical protein